RDVRSLKLDVELEDVKIDLGTLGTPIFAALAYLWPDAAISVRTFDKLSLKPVLPLLRLLGLRPERLFGHEDQAVRMFTQFDTLQGKSVELEYRDGQGVLQVVPLVGGMTRSE